MHTDTPIVCTVSSSSYRRIAREAVKRAEKFLGLEVRVIQCKDSEGFKTKLDLDKHCGRRPVLFMDSDLWFLRPWDVSKLMGHPVWMGCHDSAVWNPNAFPFLDCRDHGLDPYRYLNTGLFICDLRLPEHREVFKLARRSWRAKRRPHDKSDQFHLNKALLRLGVPINFLPPRYSFYTLSTVWGQAPFIPREIVGIHAAGVRREHKYNVLRAEASVFGRAHHPMNQQAVNRFFESSQEL